MKEKSSFVLYHDIRTPLELLNDEDRGKLFMAILNYSEFGEEPDFDGALQMAFAFIKTALDRDTTAWETKRAVRAEAGRKGGKQNQANQAMLKFASASQANQAVPVPAPVPVNNERDLCADKPPKNKSTRFIPPSVDEVRAYCAERANILPRPHGLRIAHKRLNGILDPLGFLPGFLDQGLQLAQLPALGLQFVCTHYCVPPSFIKGLHRQREALSIYALLAISISLILFRFCEVFLVLPVHLRRCCSLLTLTIIVYVPIDINRQNRQICSHIFVHIVYGHI